jgi:hypothetical protein
VSLKVVQTVAPLSAAGTATTSIGIALKSGYLRIATVTAGANIAIGGAPVATSSDLLVPVNTSEIIKERVARQRISGITTGAATTISFPENAGNPFLVGDYVTIENAYPAGINTSHNIITAVTDSSITVSFDSSSVVGVAVTNSTVARSVKVSAVGNGGTSGVNIVEVQTTGQF